MICKNCMKNIATVKFTEVVDGAVVQHHFCAQCFESYQKELQGFTMEVPKPKHRSRGRSVREKQREAFIRCESCGTPLAKIVESAAVGCALCYTAFGKEIESMLEALHRGPMHRGKSFSSSDDRIRLMSELQSKRLLLRSMLKEEKYEEAARLRDEIAHLEKQVHSSEVHSQRRGE